MPGGKGKSSGGKSSGGKTSVDGPKKQTSHSARAGLQVRFCNYRRFFTRRFARIVCRSVNLCARRRPCSKLPARV